MLYGCLDRRFRSWRGRYCELMDLEAAYPFLIPGGPKDLVYPKHPRDAEYLLEKLALLSDEYKILGVMAHNKCVACGECEDPDFYKDMLKKAGAIIKRAIPKVETALIFANFDGLYIVEEEVPAVVLA